MMDSQKPSSIIVEAAFADFYRWREAHEDDECQDILCMSERYARDCENGAWEMKETE